MKRKSAEEINAYVKVDSSFSDYGHFEGDSKLRTDQKRKFINGKVYSPHYDYKKLDKLYDVDDKGKQVQDKKRATYEAVLELEANKGSGVLSDAEYELYASFHEARLKKIMLVEAAEKIRRAGSSSEQVVARREFMEINREVYGEMNQPAFIDIMSTEKLMVASFEPATDRAQALKSYLEIYFRGQDFDGEEAPMLDDETLKLFQEIVKKRYGKALNVVPDTDDDKEYDATECREIMQKALEAGGLAEKGWFVEVSSSKSNPSTSVDSKKISLPEDTKRTASQLKRLIIHEQEVHGRRGQNGADKEIDVLEKGTAEYADVEEGLGVLLECVVAGDFDNQSFHRARDRYITAGLALGVDGIPKDAQATFNLVWRLIALKKAKNGDISETDEVEAKKLAMQHVENAFRGTNFAMPGIIYTKLKVYYEGLIKNARYFTERKDDIDTALDQAMIGKYNHTDPVETRELMEVLREKA